MTAGRAIVVTASENIDVLLDPARVRQSIENLIANAREHSPTRAPVAVVLARRMADTQSVIAITVADSGPGVPAELAPRIFDRFVSGASRGAGLGLGLFLARQIALLHGGDLSLEMPSSGGARFTLTLPGDESLAR